ncbi:type II toxin-antitoxin system PemK/MazF family toxin [Acidipropionibacterium timonense]|uniref:type II toxin-antitoxin system PemK/MazF family toxin n=1 Tax=Acidipropionibacterium timonense TaxID=2161818 RepID=UPI00102F9C74
MKRGEVWTVAGGVHSTKPRPALIVQDDVFDATDSVTVVPFTLHVVDSPLMRFRVEPGGTSGLDHSSDLMIDRITTVRRSHLGSRIGRLTSQQMADVKRLMAVFLGLAS